MSAGARLAVQESLTVSPKTHLWEPVWRWLISQNPEAVIEESGLVFKAAEAWLNWGIFAEKFPLRVEVAEFVLDLVQKILLPDPDPQELVDPNQQERRLQSESSLRTGAFRCLIGVRDRS